MRARLVIYGDLGQRTGGYLYDRMLAEGLGRRGIVVETLSLPWVSYPRRLLHNASASVRAALSSDAEVLLEDELTHPSIVLASKRCAARPKRVAIVHNLGAPAALDDAVDSSVRRAVGSARRAIEADYLAGVDGLIVNSRSTLADVARVRPALPPHIVAPAAADHLFARFPAPSDAELSRRASERPVRLLSVGNVTPVKGLHLLVPALAAIRDEAWSLDVVGSLDRDPVHARAVQAELRRAGLAEKVRFLGELAPEAVAERYLGASIFVLPSPAEGFGIAYLEAMGFGLAVVASTGGAAPELMRDGVDGVLVDPRRTAALAVTLAGLICDPARVERIGRAARDRARAHPSWDDSAARVARFLREVVAAGPSSSAPERSTGLSQPGNF